MFFKCAIAIIIAAVTGAMLLGLRQQRFETMHNMAKIHSGMNSTRQTMWNLQTRVAGHIQPARLQEAITQANLPFETFTPSTPVEAKLASSQQNFGLNLLKTRPIDIDLGLADGQPGHDKHDKPDRLDKLNKSDKPDVATVSNKKPANTTGNSGNSAPTNSNTKKPGSVVSSRHSRTSHNAAPARVTLVRTSQNRNRH